MHLEYSGIPLRTKHQKLRTMGRRNIRNRGIKRKRGIRTDKIKIGNKIRNGKSSIENSIRKFKNNFWWKIKIKRKPINSDQKLRTIGKINKNISLRIK